MVVAIVIVLALGVLALAAWWWSGRARGVEHHSLLATERGEAEFRTMKHYRPNGANGPGPTV